MSALVVANWKMGVEHRRALGECRVLARSTTANERARVVICPSFPDIAAIRSAFPSFSIGAQDCSGYERGAYTGDVAAADLRTLGCRVVILGHSERRRYYHETNSVVAAKMRLAVKVGLTPILCVGENRQEHQRGSAKRVVWRQLSVLTQQPIRASSQIIIAYEPIWAVGAPRPAGAETIAQMHAEIARWLQKFGIQKRQRKILYGGAVDSSTITSICQLPHVGGVLVGRASWTGEGLAALLHATS